MVRGKEILLEDRVAIKTLGEAGYSFSEIANKLGCSKSVAYKVYNHFQQTGNLAVGKTAGRPKILSERDEHVLEI